MHGRPPLALLRSLGPLAVLSLAILATACDTSVTDPGDDPILVPTPLLSTVEGCVAKPDGILAWWPGDGTLDEIIDGRDASVVMSSPAGVTYAAGKVGQAFQFDGISYLSVPDDPVWTLGDDDFTVELWVNFDGVDFRSAFIGHDDAGGIQNKWIFWYDAGGHEAPGGPALRFHINGPGIGILDPGVAPWTPTTSQWYHVAVTRSGDDYSLYIDGAWQTTRTDASTIADPAVPLTIGAAEAFRLRGRLDEVTIYERALTAAEISDIHAAGDSGKCDEDPAAPVVTEVLLSSDPVPVGTATLLEATFTDENADDTHTGTFDWGAGAVAGAVSESGGAGTLSLSQAFTEPGVYTVAATVVDDGGLSDSRSSTLDAPAYLVIYDPSGGFVTGGGWIDSPVGACTLSTCSDDTTGKAAFGFVSRYKKGASTPSGNTEFQFKAGDLNFKSAAYDWLVVAGARAQFKGSGTINGGGDYGFLLTAIDGDLNGGGGADRFRIKIVDRTSGDVVYDNQRGSDETSDATTELGGGNIRIHM